MPWSILRLGKEQYFDVELVSTSIATPNILCLFRSIRWTKESGKTFSHTFAWRIYHRQRGIVWHFLMPLLSIDICEMNNLRILLQFYFYDDTIDIETEFDSSEEQHFLFLIERFRRRFQVRLQSIEGSMGNHLILVLISSITSWALRESWENWKLSWTIRFTLVLSMLRSPRRSFNFPNNETSLSLRHRLCDAFSAIFIFWRTEDELAHSSYFFLSYPQSPGCDLRVSSIVCPLWNFFFSKKICYI